MSDVTGYDAQRECAEPIAFCSRCAQLLVGDEVVECAECQGVICRSCAGQHPDDDDLVLCSACWCCP